MSKFFENWKIQLRKGYLELCVLSLIKREQRLYGLDLLERLAAAGLDVKEGTLYPILNRMSVDKLLKATWETEGARGHPRKFYSLSRDGEKLLNQMLEEYNGLSSVLDELKSRRGHD